MHGGSGSLHVLFVVPYVPSPLRPRPFHLVRSLASRGHKVGVVAAATSARELADASGLAPYCARLRVARIARRRAVWSCLSGLAGAAPLQALYCRDPIMTGHIREALNGPDAYDVVHVEHLRAALYGLEMRGLPRVYDAVDCMSGLQAHASVHGPTVASRLIARAELGRTRRFERALLEAFDRVLVSAESERDALLALAPPVANDDGTRRVCVLPNGVDLDYFRPVAAARDEATLVFVGRMAYHANVAAAQALLTDVMPAVWARRPAVRVLVVGDDPPAALRTLAARAGGPVEITGYVPDVRPYLARATIAVTPLPYAVGIQNKVLEAMATATPVIATPAACGGLSARHGDELVVATVPDGFAAAIGRLLEDPALAARIGAAGRRYVERRHDWNAVTGRLESIYREAVADHGGARTAARMGGA